MPSAATRALVGLLAAFGLAACIASPGSARLCLDAEGLEFECVALVGSLLELREEDGVVNGYPIAGAVYNVTSRSAEGLVDGVTNANGGFVADGLETGTPVALAFQKSGYAPAVFSGETAERDSFFYNGSVFQETLETVQELVDEYSVAVLGTGSLMTVGSGGGAIVRGRVRSFRELVDGIPRFDEVGGAMVEVFDGANNSLPVYYRADDPDGDGEVDPTATATNEYNASFAAFAVTATSASSVLGRDVGSVTVRVTLDGRTAEETTYVIDGGITELGRFSPP